MEEENKNGIGNSSEKKPDEELYVIAKKRAQEIRGFYNHLIVWAAVCTGLALINILTMLPSGYFYLWFLWPTCFWGFGLFWHAMGVFVFNKGEAWEERKAKQIMEQLKEKK